MTVHASIPLPAENALTPFILLRHELIEAFATVELTICQCLARFVPDFKLADATPLSAKIKALESAKASPQLSKAHLDRIQAACKPFPGLLKTRAAVVHGKLRTGVVDTIPIAVFQDSASMARSMNCHVLLTESDFHSDIQTLLRLEGVLRGVLHARVPTPPSCSPEQPA